jgi:hypothetical protein
MNRALRWPVAIALSGALLSGLVAAGVHGPIRLPLTMWFLLVCTGMSFVPLFSIREPAIELATGVGASVALDTLVTTTILVVGGLSATSGLLALDGLCLVGCALQVGRWRRRCS